MPFLPFPMGKMGDFVLGTNGIDGFLFLPLVPNVFANGRPIAVIGTLVSPHRRLPPHRGAVMVTGSLNVFAGPALLPVCKAGDIASCGDPLLAIGNVFVN